MFNFIRQIFKTQKEKDEEWVKQEEPVPVEDTIEPPKEEVLNVVNFKPAAVGARQYVNFFRDRLGLEIIKRGEPIFNVLAHGFYWQQCYEYAKEKGWL